MEGFLNRYFSIFSRFRRRSTYERGLVFLFTELGSRSRQYERDLIMIFQKVTIKSKSRIRSTVRRRIECGTSKIIVVLYATVNPLAIKGR